MLLSVRTVERSIRASWQKYVRSLHKKVVQVKHNLIPHYMQLKIRRIWMSWSNKGFQVLKKLMYLYIPPYIRKCNTLKIVSCFMFKAIWCLWLSISKRYSNLQTRLIYETKDISFSHPVGESLTDKEFTTKENNHNKIMIFNNFN